MTDVDPSRGPTDTSIAADSAHLEVRRVDNLGDPPREGSKGWEVEVAGRVLAEGFVGTFEVELRAEAVEGSLLGA